MIGLGARRRQRRVAAVVLALIFHPPQSQRAQVAARSPKLAKSSMFVTPMPRASLSGAEATTRLRKRKRKPLAWN